MTDELQIIELQPGDGKAAVKGALITTNTPAGWKTVLSSTRPGAEANRFSA